MVVKEQGCEKEELKLDKFTYHVDAEEEEDPALHVPGNIHGKLCCPI